jgi:hypothetical protein
MALVHDVCSGLLMLVEEVKVNLVVIVVSFLIKNDIIEERKRRLHGENKIIYYSAWKNHV